MSSEVVATPHFALEPGERQLWVGQPTQGMYLSPPKRMSIVPILGATLFGIFVSSFNFLNRVSLAVPIVLIAALFVGAFASLFVDRRRRARTTYVITDRRAIITDGDRVQSYPLEQLRDARLVENTDGTHNLEWGEGKFVCLRNALEPYHALRSLTTGGQ